MTDINIVILDDHPIVVAGLKQLLMNEKGLKIVGSFHKGSEILSFIKENPVDLILLDITLPDSNGIELCREIKKERPGIVILMLSNRSERSIIMQSIQYGASGYLLKNASTEELLYAIKESLAGNISFCNEVKAIISKPVTYDFNEFPKLTKREKEILKMITEGKTSLMIANELSLSVLTVDTHRKNIMNKFKAKNVAELTKIVVQMDLLL